MVVLANILGWHVCRTKLARKIFFEARIFSRKMLRNFGAFILWVRKNPAKLPLNFPPNLPPQNQEKSLTSFCRGSHAKTYPRSGFFVPEEHANVPSFRASLNLGWPWAAYRVGESAEICRALCDLNQKSLGVHIILVRQIWFYPPPKKRAGNEEIIVQISGKSSKSTLFPGGGGGDAM